MNKNRIIPGALLLVSVFLVSCASPKVIEIKAEAGEAIGATEYHKVTSVLIKDKKDRRVYYGPIRIYEDKIMVLKKQNNVMFRDLEGNWELLPNEKVGVIYAAYRGNGAKTVLVVTGLLFIGGVIADMGYDEEDDFLNLGPHLYKLLGVGLGIALSPVTGTMGAAVWNYKVPIWDHTDYEDMSLDYFPMVKKMKLLMEVE